ncbi:hypothetical protein C8J56DRAFT_1012516 [Mycena floridula]|nr:hypothetical protein C8J56DRAFT_1012516 [Mycena floridula]
MSDIDDELLELVSDTKKRKKNSKSASKRRKTEASDSEEDNNGDPYPLEGKYADEEDRERLLQMSEFDREQIIEKRLEERDKKNHSKKLSDFLAQNQSGDNVSAAAKRQHTARGATREKDKKLSELKAKRKAKAETKRPRDETTREHGERSSSPMEMETDDEDEDGQVGPDDQEQEKSEGPVTIEDLSKVWVSRDFLIKHWAKPWFDTLVDGAWVRYLIGQEGGRPIYRICEIVTGHINFVAPYKVGDKTVNQLLTLRHGKSSKHFPMDKVSNTCFDSKEFERLTLTCANEKVSLPTKHDLQQKEATISKLASQVLTDSDITVMVARKSQLAAGQAPSGLTSLERARLLQERTLAIRRHDYDEVAELDRKLEAAPPTQVFLDQANSSDILAKLSERNRKANSEAVRKAELLESEKRRKERKLAMSGTATPTDPSARLRTVPRTMLTASPSRPGTPVPGAGLLLQPELGQKASTSPGPAKRFEVSVVDSIDVDLGDF